MTQEVPFPSPLELTVASALLLLSSPDQQATSFSLLSTSYGDEESVSMNESLASSSSGSKRSASWLTSEASSDEIRAHQLRIIAVVARCHEMKLKVLILCCYDKFSLLNLLSSLFDKSCERVARRSAGKSQRPKPQPPTVKSVSSEALSTEAGSSLSSSASAITSARSPCVSGRRQMMVAREKPKRKTGGSTHIQRRADAILKLLSSGGCSSETRIRRFLGDSPDTSKALRMLLKLDEVKRSGTGGRQDPYIYTIA
ncbi:hypothetical protein Patl1_20513 [Pistacia atlantica]|uniref:Uncharacterized protein n=1 Tax=Pistacia atlantica TaxID=434234 RepID=A0ACC1BHF3_9ROSI|nr:hypothetical protein Patl1_20513 [Pistacia atlantica]